MSLHISAVSVEGDARASLESLFAKCVYKSSAPPESVPAWDHLHNALINPEDKGVVYHDTRTTIIDPELVMMFDEEPLKEISKKFGSVLTMICEGISATYGFAVYRGGEKIRSLTVISGEIIHQFGESLPEEGDIDALSLSEEAVLDILSRLGFDYSSMEKGNQFEVYHLEFAGGELE